MIPSSGQNVDAEPVSSPSDSEVNQPNPESIEQRPTRGAPPASDRGLVVVAVIAVVLALAVSGMFAAHVIKLGGSATPVSPGAPAPTNYTVSFAESGLQTGTSWSISFNLTNSSSSSSMISFSSPNGTFSYTVGSVKGYDATPSSGSVKIAGANPSTIEIAFALSNGARSYDTNFTEQGLASGQSWGVTLNGTTLSSTDSTISFTEPNGKYAYTVDPVSGYHFSPASGTVTVAGSSSPRSANRRSSPWRSRKRVYPPGRIGR